MPPVQCSTSLSTALHHPVAPSLSPSAPELGLGFRQPRLSDAMERYRGDRDRDRERDRDRDRSRERDRDRDRYGGGPEFPHQTRRPSLFSDGPPVDQRRSPGNYRGGFSGPGGGRRAFESPSRHSPVDAGAGFPPVGGGPPGGFRPLGGGVGGGFGNDFQATPAPLSGQKRGFPFSGCADSPEHYDGRSDAPSRNFVKLFVGSVPRTATEEDIRPLFEGQGKVLEVALIKDKRTGQQQGCCFVKYATSEEADRAIRALHNQYTLPGGVGPIQVRYADGERERLGNGAVEYKLFVGSLNKFATEKEVEEIFAPYGRVEDVYLMRDERKQSRGCGFVKFSNKDSALGAINALNGTYTMRGCDQPLIVRFADPKRPKPGEQRTGPASGGPGFGPVPPAGVRPAPGPNYPGSLGARGPPGAWQPMSPQNLIPPPHTSGVHGFSNQFPPRSGDAPISATAVGHLGPQGNAADGSGPGAVSAASTSPQNFNQSYPQPPASGQQISPLQKPLPSPQHFPSSLPQHQGPGSYSQAQVTQASMRPVNQSQTAGQAQYSQAFPSQHVPGLTGPLPSAQYPVQQSAPSGVGQQNRPSMNVQGHTTSSLANPHVPGPAQQQPLPFQQSPSQLAQMLSQQTQTLQASFQSSQQAFSQLQQQVQMMQPSNHNQPLQQNYQALKHQSQWAGVTPSTAGNTPTIASKSDVPSTSSAPVGLLGAATPAPVKCNWTEHMSPDGYKYYHNSATGESTWIKPEELTLYEQQQQKVSVQQPPNQPSLQAFPTQRVTQSTQSQPPQVQTQFRQTEQFQHPPVSSMYQGPRGVTNQTVQEAAYTQLQTPTNSVIDPARFQQGFQASQDWAWKSNSGGI